MAPSRWQLAPGRWHRQGAPGYRVKRRGSWAVADFSALAPRRLLSECKGHVFRK